MRKDSRGGSHDPHVGEAVTAHARQLASRCGGGGSQHLEHIQGPSYVARKALRGAFLRIPDLAHAEVARAPGASSAVSFLRQPPLLLPQLVICDGTSRLV